MLRPHRVQSPLAATGTASVSEARRLISQGAVQIDGEKVSEDGDASVLRPDSILRAGRRRFARLT